MLCLQLVLKVRALSYCPHNYAKKKKNYKLCCETQCSYYFLLSKPSFFFQVCGHSSPLSMLPHKSMLMKLVLLTFCQANVPPPQYAFAE